MRETAFFTGRRQRSFGSGWGIAQPMMSSDYCASVAARSKHSCNMKKLGFSRWREACARPAGTGELQSTTAVLILFDDEPDGGTGRWEAIQPKSEIRLISARCIR